MSSIPQIESAFPTFSASTSNISMSSSAYLMSQSMTHERRNSFSELSMASTTSASCSPYSSNWRVPLNSPCVSPALELSHISPELLAEQHIVKNKLNAKRDREQYCRNSKMTYNAESEAKVAALKAVTKEHPDPSDYSRDAEVHCLRFEYRTKIDIPHYILTAYRAIDFLSDLTGFAAIKSAVRNANLTDVLSDGYRVGNISYQFIRRIAKEGIEVRPTNLLNCDILSRDPLLAEYELEEFVPCKSESRTNVTAQRLQGLISDINEDGDLSNFRLRRNEVLNRALDQVVRVNPGELAFAGFQARSRSVFMEVTGLYYARSMFIEQIGLGQVAPEIMDYVGSDFIDSAADALVELFMNSCMQKRNCRVTISLSLYYNLRQQFLRPSVNEKTLLSDLIDVAIRSGNHEIPAYGDVYYETAMFTFWHILSKLSSEYRYDSVQISKFVSRLNLASP